VRYIEVEKGEGASERTKFSELLQQITIVNEIGGIVVSLGYFGKTVLKSVGVKRLPASGNVIVTGPASKSNTDIE